MKSIAVLLVVALATVQTSPLNEPPLHTLAKEARECITESQVDLRLVMDGFHGQFSDNSNLKKFYGCAFRKANFINENNEVQHDVIQTSISSRVKPEDVTNVEAACKEKMGENVDETAYLLYKCFKENTPERISLIQIHP